MCTSSLLHWHSQLVYCVRQMHSLVGNGRKAGIIRVQMDAHCDVRLAPRYLPCMPQIWPDWGKSPWGTLQFTGNPSVSCPLYWKIVFWHFQVRFKPIVCCANNAKVIISLLNLVSVFCSLFSKYLIRGCQSTRHTVNSSHSQLVTGQLVTRSTRHAVDSSQAHKQANIKAVLLQQYNYP